MADRNLIVKAPPPPSLMKSLMAGFDAITSNLVLLLFPIFLDGFLWLGPRIRLYERLKPVFQDAMSISELQSAEFLANIESVLSSFNLFSVLRTLPIGIPSLMVSRSLVETPAGIRWEWEIPSLQLGLTAWLGLTFIGLSLGSLYFRAIAQATLPDGLHWNLVLTDWPRVMLQVLLLTIVWFALLMAVFLPFSCFISLFLVSGAGLNQLTLFILLLAGGVLVWLFVPLVFSAHGIFTAQLPVWQSIRLGYRLARMTLPTTTLFLVVALVISEGLNYLWNVPKDASWWLLVGVFGHAFIATALLAASFVYYRDAQTFVQAVLHNARMSLA